MIREVADELYIKRVLMVLEDFLFFSLYSFSCIASNSPTLKHILIFVPRYVLRVQSCNIHISYVRPCPLQSSPLPSSPLPSSPLPLSPSASDRICTYTPTIGGKRGAGSAGKSELEICSPQAAIVYLDGRLGGGNCQHHADEAL